jgi:hypothetical protein
VNINLLKHHLKILAQDYLAFWRFLSSRELRITIANSTYVGDGIITKHFLPFGDEDMSRSYAESFDQIPKHHKTLRKIEWRFSILVWAMHQTRQVPGDVIECGVWYGVLSRALLNQFHASDPRRFVLLDSWGESGFSMLGPYKRSNYLKDIFEVVQNRFRGTNAVFVRGSLPETVSKIDSEKISLLMIDLNSGSLEKEIMEMLWDKLPINAIVYLDDYGQDFPLVRKAIDEFVYEYNQSLLVFPTGQAVIIKA